MKNHYIKYRSLWSKLPLFCLAIALLSYCKSGSKTNESYGKVENQKQEVSPTQSNKKGTVNKDSMYKANPQPMKEAPKPGRGPK